MNPLLQCKPTILPLFIAGVLACFGLLPTARAVVPQPDGGYAGQNTAEGQSALLHLASGTYNTALGWTSLGFNVTGNYNTGVGAGTLLANNADNNTATGAGALLSNTTGGQNTANGAFALLSNVSGSSNTAIGQAALDVNINGNSNTAIGASALSNSTSSFNTAIGNLALVSTTTGVGNIGLGFMAGASHTTGNGNIDIGNLGVLGESNTIRIGVPGAAINCYIAGIFGATAFNSAAVFVGSDGKLGTITSSARFKEGIRSMEQASEALFALKPVTFRYKKDIDPDGTSQFGLVAEDVEQVNPDLVIRDAQGRPQTVRYEQINAMLLNEFLKEHRKVEELRSTVATKLATIADLKSTVAQQQKGLELLTARLNEQAAQIQKVSAQLEVSKPAPQVVVNKP
jgi:trimeric autotransporter adhesin